MVMMMMVMMVMVMMVMVMMVISLDVGHVGNESSDWFARRKKRLFKLKA
jgi:uncharacterized protein HemY